MVFFCALSLTKIPSSNIELIGKQQFVTQFVVLIGKLFLAGLCNIKKQVGFLLNIFDIL